MTDAILAAAIGAIPGTVAAFLGYFNRRSIKENRAEVKKEAVRLGGEVISAKSEISALGKQIDGRMSEQIELTKQIGFIAGQKQEKSDEARKVKRRLTQAAPKNDR